MLEAGVPVGAGTDATRVSSYNPWTAMQWLVTGRTVGGLELTAANQRLSRETALALWTSGSAWFSSEQGKKGQIAAGQLADLAVLTADYFRVPEQQIDTLASVLTVVGGKIVHGSEEFGPWSPPPIPVLPEWSPLKIAPGLYRPAAAPAAKAAALPHQCAGACSVHAHQHDRARKSAMPVSDPTSFWGVFGCSCFAF